MAKEKLSLLISKVDALFVGSRPRLNETYNYSLGRFPSGWCFTVTNNWYRWQDAGFQHEFRLFSTPEQAIEAFLDYVAVNKIDVGSLIGEANA